MPAWVRIGSGLPAILQECTPNASQGRQEHEIPDSLAGAQCIYLLTFNADNLF